ncbi:MAG TPA: hypothetical protein PL196_09210, partial [Burkholderiaceae bacterium]|nr:hypothetical protein [Burkholderiaceae bacterium]
TLSTHAGVLKPDRRVFETALRRLRSKAPLDRCLLVTENVAHARAAIDELGMQALVFRPPAGTTIGFDDWSQAPALVARLVDGPADNVSAATRVYLGAREIEAGDVTPGADASTLHVSGRSWRALNVPGEPDLDGVMVPIPVRGELRRGAHGELVGHLGEPSDEEVAEATNAVKSLAAHRQIEGRTDGQVGAATHAIEADASGRRRLVRKRFTAV